MFQRPINENKIPPNFLNSILTNESLYNMFKNQFDENKEYFQSIDKEEYLYSMLNFINKKLTSDNLFQIYDEDTSKIEESNVLLYIKNFYDDFMLPFIKEKNERIFETEFFKSLDYAKYKDIYAGKSETFEKLYDYIFKESINYNKIENDIIDRIKDELDNSSLTLSDFDILLNYVKNNRYGYISMDLVCKMIKNHAYKSNHIFDREVVKVILYSVMRDYFISYDIEPKIEYTELVMFKDEVTHDKSTNTIYIDSILIDTFISGNYVELFNDLFYKMELLKYDLLLDKNELSLDTLHIIMNLINQKVDIEKYVLDTKYRPYAYISDLRASSFVKTLKFYQHLGVDLFDSYVNSEIKKVDFTDMSDANFRKEISKEIIFSSKLSKMDKEKLQGLRGKYQVLAFFYNEEGLRKRAIELLKKYTDFKELVSSYLCASIPTPDEMIDDVVDLANYKSKDSEKFDFVSNLLKYIYSDLFYYSLDGYVKLNNEKTSFDEEEYLDNIYIKISCIKDTPLTHRFIDNALSIIDEMKQTA